MRSGGIVGVYWLRRVVDILGRVVANGLRLIATVLDWVVIVTGGVGRWRTVDGWEESGTSGVVRISPVSVETVFLLLVVQEVPHQERPQDPDTNTHHGSINQGVAGTENLRLGTGCCSGLLFIFSREDLITEMFDIKTSRNYNCDKVEKDSEEL